MSTRATGRYDEIVSVIRDINADVVLLIEVNAELGAQLEDLDDLYPVRQINASSGAFGIAVLSREPFAELTIERIGNELFNTVVARFDDGITFVGAHMLPPAGANYSRIRNRQLQELAQLVDSQAGPRHSGGRSERLSLVAALPATHSRRRTDRYPPRPGPPQQLAGTATADADSD